MAEESLLALNSVRLSQSFCGMLKDMRGLDYRPDRANGRERRSGLPGGGFPLKVGIRFSGAVNGEYALYLGYETAARLAGLWSADRGLAALEAAREDSESLVKEVLNSSVGTAIRELERSAGALDFDPAVSGPADAGVSKSMAPKTWGEMLVLGDAGPVLCCFFLDPRGAGDAP